MNSGKKKKNPSAGHSLSSYKKLITTSNIVKWVWNWKELECFELVIRPYHWFLTGQSRILPALLQSWLLSLDSYSQAVRLRTVIVRSLGGLLSLDKKGSLILLASAEKHVWKSEGSFWNKVCIKNIWGGWDSGNYSSVFVFLCTRKEHRFRWC